jgi:demethylspheroidene O-methyltransferase
MAWLDYGRNLRNRLLSSQQFQNWAAAFPLTRPIARRQAREMFDLCAGFVYSQILFACVQLNLLELLSESPRTAAELGKTLQMPAGAVETLLRAASSLKLAAPGAGQQYRLGQRGAVLLGNPGILAMIRHHSLLYRDLADPVALLRGEQNENALATHWPYAGNGEPRDLAESSIATYTELMAASQPFIATEILEAYSFKAAGHKCLLDVGGGDGSFLTRVAEQDNEMRLMLFDLPAVAELARHRFEQAGLDHRASVAGGDMRSDPLPDGADIVSLVRVIHDHDDDDALSILRNVRRALPGDGHLLIAEPMAGTPGAAPVGDAYFGFYLLAMGSGRPRTFEEIKSMLHKTGYGQIQLRRTRMPLLTRLITARPE